MSKRVILPGILIILIVTVMAFSAITAVQAFNTFQQQHTRAQAGDVSAIRSWMTIHYIARICHVPENYLYRSLQINNPNAVRRDNLETIATLKHRSVAAIIRTLQESILLYRKTHPPPSVTPSPGRQQSTRRAVW